MTRSVFYGFGAYVGSLTGRTSCGFWPDDPDQLGWSSSTLVPVDLGKNPEAVRQGLITVADLQCDDFAGYAFGGHTQIGPMWPGGRMNGAVWLESHYWQSLGAARPPRANPGLQHRPYELASVLYWDGPLAGRRFSGVYGEIRPGQTSGTRNLVALWERGSSQVPGKQPFGTFWLDFTRDVHPIETDFTEVGTGNAPQSGALFVDSKVLAAMAAPITKTPKANGGAIPPRRRRA